VTDVTQISRIDGTESEGQMLPQWADQRHLRSIAVVAGKDHSRRLRRVLDRDMKGHSTHVAVRAARCHFDSREEAARVTDGGSSTTGVARRANATFGLS
jgi:hypothetical protein